MRQWLTTLRHKPEIPYRRSLIKFGRERWASQPRDMYSSDTIDLMNIIFRKLLIAMLHRTYFSYIEIDYKEDLASLIFVTYSVVK